MNSRLVLWFSLVCVLFLSGCAAEPAVPARDVPAARPAPHYAREFAPQPCWFELPEGAEVTCGYLTVPEDRQRPLTPENSLELALAIFHSQAETPAPDPIVYQVGGPGGHMLRIVPDIYKSVIEPFLQSRDLIFFDPRGTGFSQPVLACEKEEVAGECVRQFFADGRNLHAYSSVSLAADLQAIRAALGYDQWNLIGQSYGTHVAQVTLREAPEGLRSVIMDSVLPIVPPEPPAGRSFFEAALQRLFQRCEADSACNAAYPHLSDALQRATQRLDESPITLQTNCFGEAQSASLTGGRLTSLLFSALHGMDNVPALPGAIAAAADGRDYSFWKDVICQEVRIDALITDGAYLAMMCSDGRLSGRCQDWPVVVEQTAVTSEIPVLILSGEFDPVTPLAYGHSVAQTLPHSYVVDVPATGHWVNGTGHPCQAQIIQAFLADPTRELDTSCLAELEDIAFVIEP